MRFSARYSLLAFVLSCLFIASCKKEERLSTLVYIEPKIIGPLDTVITTRFSPFQLTVWDYDSRIGLWKGSSYFKLPYRAIEVSIKIFIASQNSNSWVEVPDVKNEKDIFYTINTEGYFSINVYETQFHLMDFDKKIDVRINYKKVE